MIYHPVYLLTALLSIRLAKHYLCNAISYFIVVILYFLGTEFSGPPQYTVTSPRPSVDNTASGMKFTVQPTPDFKPQPQQEADCSVLLKLKKGDEYKLVLNMQNYNPENITVKLNGNELTVLATAGEGSTDDFKQTHVVPDGIDLDQMSSSFSADGVLVVKAPRKN